MKKLFLLALFVLPLSAFAQTESSPFFQNFVLDSPTGTPVTGHFAMIYYGLLDPASNNIHSVCVYQINNSLLAAENSGDPNIPLSGFEYDTYGNELPVVMIATTDPTQDTCNNYTEMQVAQMFPNNIWVSPSHPSAVCSVGSNGDMTAQPTTYAYQQIAGTLDSYPVVSQSYPCTSVPTQFDKYNIQGSLSTTPTYEDWIFVNGIIIFLLALLGLRGVLNLFKS